MKIKLTHTGAIPINEYPDDQEFIVIRNNELAPMFICKKSSYFRIVGDSNLHILHIHGREEFLAWEPVSLNLPSPTLITRRLWLETPCLSGSKNWVFRLYEDPRERISTWIRDPQFNQDFFTDPKLLVGFGDVFEATMSKISNSDGLVEIYKIRQIGNEKEKFREFLDGI